MSKIKKIRVDKKVTKKLLKADIIGKLYKLGVTGNFSNLKIKTIKNWYNKHTKTINTMP